MVIRTPALFVIFGAIVLATGCVRTLAPTNAPSDDDVKALTAFDYAPLAEVLKRFVDDKGRVDYAGLRKDRRALDDFVGLVSKVGPKSRPELFKAPDAPLAYYLNAYNALVLTGVLAQDPDVTSIGESKLAQARFFYTTRYVVDGETINLYDLENSVVRKEFNEPRVHFALNCASAGCPRLPPRPFLPATLQAQLDAETARFLHEPRNVTVDGETVVLSQIFEWFPEDFSPTPVAWIRAQAPDVGVAQNAKVKFVPWDWSLNDQATRPNAAR